MPSVVARRREMVFRPTHDGVPHGYCQSPASAETVLDTGAPQSGFFGWWGYDVYVAQSVTIGFTVAQDLRARLGGAVADEQ